MAADWPPAWQTAPQSVVVVPMPMMPLAPKFCTVPRLAPPPAEHAAGTALNWPVSDSTCSGMPATASPPMVKSALRTEPKT